MGIDPATADHLSDAVDQHIEEAVACVETIIAVAQQTSEPLPAEERAELIDKLHGAAEDIEEAVARAGPIVAAAEDPLYSGDPTVGLPPADVREATADTGRAVEQLDTGITEAAASHGRVHGAQQDANIDDLDRATQRIKEAVENVASMAVAAREGSSEAHAAEALRHIEQEIDEAIGTVPSSARDTGHHRTR